MVRAIMADLILVRHGQSTFNESNRFTGKIDAPLTMQGRRDALKTAQVLLLNGIHIDFAAASSLRRASETGYLCRDELERGGHPYFEIEETDALQERSYGILEGLEKPRIKKRLKDSTINRLLHTYSGRVYCGESYKSLIEGRTGQYIHEEIMPRLKAGKNVALFSHRNTIGALLIHFGIATAEQVRQIPIKNGRPLVLNVDAQGRVKRNFRTLRFAGL